MQARIKTEIYWITILPADFGATSFSNTPSLQRSHEFNFLSCGKTYPTIFWPGVGPEYDNSGHGELQDVLDRKK